MNGTPDNIIVNSCELTPIYLIQDSGVAQATSYVLAPASQVEQKPVSNLKRFYESSGNLEKSMLLSSPEPPAVKPRILKKTDAGQIGNNLKLASFLVPKTSAAPIIQPQPIKPVQTVNNILFKPAVATVAAPTSNVALTMTHAVPKIDMDRKIVKLKPCDTASRHFHGRSVPKIKPKEVTPEPQRYTSVQLLKLGETYHSLNVLSDDQVKMVNQALNIIKDPEKIPVEPAYDPVTNTRFIYKVVSPKDLKVVGRNKVLVKERAPRRLVPAPAPAPGDNGISAGTVVTRSGRRVRLPRQVVEEPDACTHAHTHAHAHTNAAHAHMHKPRKRTGSVVTCAQCNTDFGSLYQLQKHYESNPTHTPSKVHWNLYHCLLAIMAGSPAEARAKLFVQQLEQLMKKLQALLPCLLSGQEATDIGEGVGRLFGLNSGKYNLNMDALNCVKDKEGYCQHNPAPPKPSPVANQFSADVNKPSQLWLSKHNEEIANIELEEDCARINTVTKWPTINNANKPYIKPKPQKNAKKMRIAPENTESLIDLASDNLITLSTNECAINPPQKMVSLLKNDNDQHEIENQISTESVFEEAIKKPKAHIQFHSTHFDIRSSPIKPSSSTVFRTFQINPEKIEKLNVQIIRPLELDQTPKEPIKETPTTSECTKLDSIFRDEIEMSCKDLNNELNNGLNFDSSKDWAISVTTNDQSHDSFIKSNTLIEPSLIHVKDDHIHNALPDNALSYNDMNQNGDMPVLNDETDNSENRLSLSQSQSVLNFLETLGNELTYPEPEIRNTSVDFQLDLFSFNNT